MALPGKAHPPPISAAIATPQSPTQIPPFPQSASSILMDAMSMRILLGRTDARILVVGQ